MDVDVDVKQKKDVYADEKEQLKKIMKLCETFNLVKVNHILKVDNDMLNFLLTNDVAFFKDIEIKTG